MRATGVEAWMTPRSIQPVDHSHQCVHGRAADRPPGSVVELLVAAELAEQARQHARPAVVRAGEVQGVRQHVISQSAGVRHLDG